jgi:hypothetical protein
MEFLPIKEVVAIFRDVKADYSDFKHDFIQLKICTSQDVLEP